MSSGVALSSFDIDMGVGVVVPSGGVSAWDCVGVSIPEDDVIADVDALSSPLLAGWGRGLCLSNATLLCRVGNAPFSCPLSTSSSSTSFSALEPSNEAVVVVGVAVEGVA